MHTNLIFWLPLIFYGLALFYLGYRAIRKGGTGDVDYFLAGRSIGPLPALISVAATETSVATIVVFPAAGMAGGLKLLWLGLGFILGRQIVARFYLEKLYREYKLSIYDNISFGHPISGRFLSAAYLLSKYLSGGIRFYLGAYAFNQILPWSLSGWIILIALIAGIYSSMGGLRAVIWTDQIQGALILILGALFFYEISMGLEALEANAFRMPAWIDLDHSYNNSLYAPALFFGGIIISIGSHGADQDMLQRILAVRDIRAARRALGLSAFVAFAILALYLYIGHLIGIVDPGVNARSPLASHIADGGNPLLNGIFACLLLAAAMSTLDSAMHSTGAVWKSLFARARFSGWTYSLFSLFIFVDFAMAFIWISDLERGEKISLSLVRLAMESMNYINGGLIAALSVHLFLPRYKSGYGIICGILSGALTAFASSWAFKPPLAWTWSAILSAGVAMASYLILTILLKKIRNFRNI